MEPLTLKELYLGHIDAKNELLKGTEKEREIFLGGFYPPPNIVPEDFVEGKKYFVTGLKGIGKTALLRYISIQTEINKGACSEFVLFKSEISEDDRKSFGHAANTTLVENNVSDYEGADYEIVWRWFLHKEIVESINKRNLKVFQRDSEWDKYSSCVLAPHLGDEESGIKRLIPRLKKGSIEISSKPKLGIEFDWEDKSQTRVKFSNIAKQADELFSKLKPGTGMLCLFVDELELNIGSSKQYKRDSALIRDLIISIERINSLSKKNNFQLCIYAAVRSEVISAIESTGKEINKIVSDFGSQIIWHRSGTDVENHPLLQIILRRLYMSEKENKRNFEYDHKLLWNMYFPKKIQNTESERYLLHQTWYRPRDIVRLLNIARDQYPDLKGFSHRVFDGVRKEYSKQCWTEITEELSARYSKPEIEAIRQTFNAYKDTFTIYELQTHMEKRSQLYPEIDSFIKKYKIGSIVTDLYKIGVLGNLVEAPGGNKKMRFSFRDDPDVILEEKLVVHKALKSFLTL